MDWLISKYVRFLISIILTLFGMCFPNRLLTHIGFGYPFKFLNYYGGLNFDLSALHLLYNLLIFYAALTLLIKLKYIRY